MGPNAFPIPFAEKITRKKEFDIRFNTHQNSGEKSWDFYTRFALPLGDKAALKIEMNPIEYFQMDTSIRIGESLEMSFLKAMPLAIFW